MHDEKIHWIRYGIYLEILMLLYFTIMYIIKVLNIEVGIYRDYLLDSYSIILFPGLRIEEMISSFTGKYFGLAIGIIINLIIYFLVGALIGLLIWTIKRYRTDDDF